MARLPAIAEIFARSWAEIEMARLLTYRAAEVARQRGPETLQVASMAKAVATEMASRVADKCLQVMGRFGLERGSRIERLYRVARPMRIYEGANEALWQSIGAFLSAETR